ncbi:porin family protein [Spirosoma endophyticum]|uniref:porin family protein n=1 Tax=Spirosoma endophyticum TaxID=662367 RepID=UPI0015A4FEED|nr:porin family protein [Spirosoma endophyticum]
MIGLLLTNLFPIYGQHPIDYKLGLIGGVNAALIQNSTGIQNIRWRYNLGLAIEQRFSPALGLVYQINYSRQGETVNLKYGGTGPVIGHQYITFDYVNLAIMARFRPKSERIFIQLGGQLGLLVNDYILVTDPFNQGKSFENVNKLDVGVTGGLGYRFGRHFVIDTRYYHGMKPILSDFISVNPQTGISTFNKQDKWYNRVYSLNLSYYF